MKSKIAVIVLVLVNIGLGVAVVNARRDHAREKEARDVLIQRQHQALEQHKQVGTKSI